MVKPNSSTKRSKPPPRARGRSGDPGADPRRRPRGLHPQGHRQQPNPGDRRRGRASTRRLVHYYFGTKAALADAIFERALGTLMPRIFGILADPDRTIEEKVPAIVREQIDFHSARPYLAGYMVSELHAEPERIARLHDRRHGRVPLDVHPPAAPGGRPGGEAAPDQRRAVRRQHDGPADLSVRHPAGALRAARARCRPAGAPSSRSGGASFPTSSWQGSGHDPRTRARDPRARPSSGDAARAQDTLSVERLQEAALRSDPRGQPARACSAPPPICASR